MSDLFVEVPYQAKHKAWLLTLVDGLSDSVSLQTPTQFAEEKRYLPRSVTRHAGYISFDLVPYWVEILDCFSSDSPIREVAVMKGVQIAYTTGLETVVFYVAGHLRTVPCMYATADQGLANARMNVNIMPMFLQSGMGDIFQAADTSNSRKSGVTKFMLQWVGGGYMAVEGAHNADKMRQASIMYLLMDEVDGWDWLVGKGDDPIRLFKDRCSAFWDVRKIFMGSTPDIKGMSHIERQFLRGDQRRWFCRCLKCGFPQHLRWERHNADTGKRSGFIWEMKSEGVLDPGSVRYECQNCNHGHQEHDKARFFSADNAEWRPTATAVEPGIRSYHVPALLSPPGAQPWAKSVSTWLEAMDYETGRVKDPRALKAFYNNVLGEPFEVMGMRVDFKDVSSHRRPRYRKGEIPNTYIREVCPGPVLFLTCSVDVHKSNLAVAIWGWTRGMCSWLVDYVRIQDDSEVGAGDPDSPAWGALRAIIEEAKWTADDGREYALILTLIDASWSSSTVVDFCAPYVSGVYPIMGRESPAKAQAIKEFAEFKTQIGTMGYRVLVDHYKDRLAPVLRREWVPEMGLQRPYTFNAPVDATDAELIELTVERRREKISPSGVVSYYWHRPNNAANELWDLLVYGHAGVEILAWDLFVKHFGEEDVDWPQFWDYFDTD